MNLGHTNDDDAEVTGRDDAPGRPRTIVWRRPGGIYFIASVKQLPADKVQKMPQKP
jgi:hypothetical protein